MSRVYSILGVIACLILGLDQWTKQIVVEGFQFEGESKGFLSWWSWTLVHNHAAAFGIFSSLPVAFLLAIPVLVLVALWFFFIRHFKADEIFRPAVMGLVIGGAFGNIIDRIRFGYVIDFVDWFYPSSSGKCLPLFFVGDDGTSCHWPVFNVADSAICVAIIFLLFEPWILKVSATKDRPKHAG